MDAFAAVFGLGGGAGMMVGWWAANWRRDHVPTSHQQLLRFVYTHVDDLLGATKTESIRRANARHRVMRKWWIPRPLRRAWVDFFYFVPQYGGITVLPTTKRMGRYLQLEVADTRRSRSWFPKPYHSWNVQAVVVWPTSEANFLGEGYPGIVARKIAQALRLKSVDQLEVATHPELGYIRYTRKGPAREIRTDVPHEVGVDA